MCTVSIGMAVCLGIGKAQIAVGAPWSQLTPDELAADLMTGMAGLGFVPLSLRSEGGLEDFCGACRPSRRKNAKQM